MVQQATQKPKRTRRAGLWRAVGLVVVILLLGFGWDYGWRRGAAFVDHEAGRLISESNDAGREIDCANRRVEGFPFRIGVFCDSLSLYAERGGISVKSGELRSAAQFYRPGFFIAELDGPLTAEIPGTGMYVANWRSMRSSVRASLDGFRRASLETRDLNLSAQDAGRTPAFSLSMGDGQVHLRPAAEAGRDNAIDLAVEAEDLSIERPGLPALAGFGFAGDFRLDGVRPELRPDLEVMAYLRRNGLAGKIRQARLRVSGGGSFTLSGDFDVAPDGRLTARLTLGAQNAGAVAEFMASALPDNQKLAEQVAEAMTLLAVAGSSGKGTPSITLDIDRGAVSAGFIPLGEIPPLF